jgi:signal transduction histidine kinase
MESPGARILLALAMSLALAGSALLRRRPLAAFAVLVAGTVVSTVAWRQPEIPPLQFLAGDVALCFIAATRPRRSSLAVAAVLLGMLAGYLAMRLRIEGEGGTPSEPFMALTVGIAWLIGNSIRQARDYAEKLRDQVTAQAVTAERLRIARELHDMVAHSIGIIALQAGAARRVIDSQPASACDALSAIETASRETLSGLRRVLGALRQAEPAQAAPLDPRLGPADADRLVGPGLGLADVDRLAEATTAAGVRVDVRWRGERRPLPPEIDRSAYRIIQEAVANVVRHAGTPSCRVTVDYRDGELSIEVLDSGNGRGGTEATGYGLLGMRERVGLLHGKFSAGRRPEGGFRVAARLPVPTGVR